MANDLKRINDQQSESTEVCEHRERPEMFAGRSPDSVHEHTPFTTVADAHTFIDQHDFNTECHDKIQIDYSGKDPIIGVSAKDQAIQLRDSNPDRFITILDTKVGRALCRLEETEQFSKDDLQKLWDHASKRYNEVAAIRWQALRICAIGLVKDAQEERTFNRVEYPTLKEHHGALFTDGPQTSDGQLGKHDLAYCNPKDDAGKFLPH